MINSKGKNISFNSSAKKISSIFQGYSVKDLVIALFVSDIWLPNIASQVKHQFLYAIFISIEKDKFNKTNRIYSYNDFKIFLGKVYPLLTSFPYMEDYVPELDWGDVKFHHKEINYKIFYGCEIGNIYDYLMLFQMLFTSLDEEYLKYSCRSPSDELRQCLVLQNEIISQITTQLKSQEFRQISPGHIEIPPLNFWKEASIFCSKYKLEQNVKKSFLNQFSFELGSLPSNLLNQKRFVEGIFSGNLISYFFLKYNSRYFPVMPRRYSAILFDSWSKIFVRCHKKINKEHSYFFHLNSEVYNFLKMRINNKNLLHLVCPLIKQESPHEILFAASFISKDRLFLIYVPPPFHSGKQIGNKLSKIAPKLKEAIKLISKPPIILGLPNKRQIVKYNPNTIGENLKPIIFTVLTQTSTQTQNIILTEDLPGRVLFMDQFLGIMDEIGNVEEVASFFIEYLDEIDPLIKNPLISMLDKFASFKDFYGVLVEGAQVPDIVIIDPHWGSKMRYKSLSKFWQQYPECGFLEHPCSWKIIQSSDKGIRLEARGYSGSALYCKIGSSHFFTSAPFYCMSYEQGLIANLLMETLEDYISRNETILKEHKFFDTYKRFHVSFLPYSLIKKNENFKNIRHLDPGNSFWRTDNGFFDIGVPGVRVVFNEIKLTDALEKTRDRTIEIDLLIEVLNKLNRFVSDPKLTIILSELSKQKSKKPRFMLSKIQKKVSFPEFVPVYKPSIYHYKKARKIFAESAKKIGLLPGVYKLKDAKKKLNSLRKEIVSVINNEVSKYNYEDTIPYLIERIDALNHEYEYKRLSIKHSLKHDVDYARQEKYAKEYSEYVTLHKNFVYLIEKFVQLKPSGNLVFKKEQFQFLVALVDKLHETYAASDGIHYDIFPIGISINDDFLIQVEYENNLENMQRTYGEEQAKISLGLIGNENDRVDSMRSVEDFLYELDIAFKQDLKFSLRRMVNVLQIMSQWSGYQLKGNEHSYYLAEKDKISEVCLKYIKNIKNSEIEFILDFLTLKSHDVVRVLGQEEPCDDLPVWEYRKRYSRYNLRPLILVGEKYFWGPYSARKSGVVWGHAPTSGALPIDLQSSKIQNVVEEEKKYIEGSLVNKTLEIVKRFTNQSEKNVKLHTRDRKGNHPTELGDYDVLSFYPEGNVVLNIENKDILPAFCLKDAKRIREKIFGKSDKDRGYLEKVEKRENYLKNNLVKISKALNFSINPNDLPRVISLFVSRRSYWWTRFPLRQTKVKFLRIDLLSNFLENL